MRPLPRLHVVTDDEVLAADGFPDAARRLLVRHRASVALHVRGPRTSGARLHALAAALAPAARDAGSLLLLNDRADVALAVDADGVQLGRRSMPVAAARRLRQEWLIGASVHGPDEAVEARAADFLVLGAIWATASHPGRAGAGLSLVREVRDRVGQPVVVIGGVTPDRVAAALDAGAAGVAAIRGIWGAADPADAAADYLAALSVRQGTGARRERE